MVTISPEALGDDLAVSEVVSDSAPHSEDAAARHQKSEINAKRRPQQVNAAQPAEKRKRILHACDECRRKKIKCDGKKPCIHCDVYNYKCTFDDPFKRGRNASPRQIEAVEARLQKAESLLRLLEPSLDLNELYLSTNSPEGIASALRQETPAPKVVKPGISVSEKMDDSLLGTMLENFGSLDLDDKGRWNYNGHSSTMIFMQRLQNQFGNLITPRAKTSRSGLGSQDPRFDMGLPQVFNNYASISQNYAIPSQDNARELCQVSFDLACIPNRFVHEPSFWASFEQLYTTSWESWAVEDRVFLPLLYSVMSVGCVFSNADKSTTASSDEEVFDQGFRYFSACRALLDLTDCRDLTSLQATIFMILFLQSSAELSICYPYIGIAQRAALHLGLHRNIQGNINPIERELRKRIFWTIRSVDVFVSTRLGLPISVSNDDIDQEYPLEIDDEFITKVGLLPMPSSYIPRMAGAHAHNRLLDIIIDVVKTIYPVKLAQNQEKPDRTYMISYSKIQEIEKRLQEWMEQIPTAPRPGCGEPLNSPTTERMRCMLLLSHAHVQWTMYRPFLHFASSSFRGEGIDKRSYQCASACVSAARRVIQIVRDMHRKNLLNGSYWFPTHATYFAILTLIYFILENREQPTLRKDDLEAALEGKVVLEALAKSGLAIERCSCLRSLFKHLPAKLRSFSDVSGTPGRVINQSPMQFPGKVHANGTGSGETASLLSSDQNLSSFDPILNQPAAWHSSSQQHDVRETFSDLMSMFPDPGYNTALGHNLHVTGFDPDEMRIFDEMYSRFGMDISYNDSQS